MSISTERKAKCREIFKNHHAEMILDTDRFAIIDWRDENGVKYYINYVVDKLKGTLTVNGSCGRSIANYSHPMTIPELRTSISNENDYVNNLRITTARFEYDVDVMLEKLKSMADNDSIAEFIDSDDPDNIDKFWCAVRCDLDKIIINDTDEGERLVDYAFDEFDTDGMLTYCCNCESDAIRNAILEGRRIAMPVFLWSVGFNMACEQLGIKPAHP